MAEVSEEGRFAMIWTQDNSFLLRYKAEIDEGTILVGQEL